MEKNKLLLLPFFAGLILMGYSWYISYPLSVDSPTDFVLNHISVFYWISLSLLLASMFLMATTSRSNTLKWGVSVGFVLTLYSLFFFYYRLPGPDSHYFRGLIEYFTKTANFNPSEAARVYFQWPSFFILAKTITSLSGLGETNFEFLIFGIIGFLFATTLYIYSCRISRNWGFLIAPAFFISMFYFLNYQAVPFTLSFGLLFLLFMLEGRQKNRSLTLVMFALFVGISIMHAFVALFFVLYLLMRSILNRSGQYLNLLLSTSIVYLVVQITLAPSSFAQNIRMVMTFDTEFSRLAEATLTPVSIPIDVIAQTLSRAVTIAFVIICGAGSIILLIKRKSSSLDKAIFLTGTIYSVSGIVLYVLGSRAIPLAFLPISLGAVYLFRTRLRPYLVCVILVLLILFPFIPFHSTFTSIFQTKEEYTADNFFIGSHNWTEPGLILSDYRAITYLDSIQASDAYSRPIGVIKEVDTIFCTIALGKELLYFNYSMEKIVYEKKLNTIYNNGFSYVATRSWNFSWAPVK